ncbi:type II toxin-antitoxin system RelE/ParE family toxin [Actinophytocola sediminis]
MATHPRFTLRYIALRYSINGMSWGTVELEPEVCTWLEQLPTAQFARATFYIDLLAEHGVLLGEPYTRQLDGKLRELRFYLDSDAVRVTYWIASGRRIVLLTVFRKTRMREEREIERARQALRRCVDEQHVADEGESNG